MKLKELMSIEEKLLRIEMTKIFSMPFNDIVLLKSYLSNIGEITKLYFDLVEQYCEQVKSEYVDLDYDGKKEKLQEYNDRILESDVYEVQNYHDILIFLDKYENIMRKELYS